MSLGAPCAQLRTLRARYQIRQCHFIGNTHALLHADFHCHPSLLATINSILNSTSFLRAITLCACIIPKLRTLFRQQRPYPPLCRLSSKSDNSSHHKLQISAFWRASRAIMRAVRARSQNRQQHFVSNAHVLLHADFHCNPSLLGTIKCK